MSEDDKVKPPGWNPSYETRFKKGQSGNPDGRRKTVVTDKSFIEILAEPISYLIDGKRVTTTKKEAIVRRLINQALAGTKSGDIKSVVERLDKIIPPDEEALINRYNATSISINLVESRHKIEPVDMTVNSEENETERTVEDLKCEPDDEDS